MLNAKQCQKLLAHHQQRVQCHEDGTHRLSVQAARRARRRVRILGEQLERARIAMVDQVFAEGYAPTGAGKLAAFNDILKFLDLEHPQPSLHQCKRAMAGVFINIFDYAEGKLALDCGDTSVKDRILRELVFHNKKDLRHRCQTAGFYPRDEAKKRWWNVLLAHLTS